MSRTFTSAFARLRRVCRLRIGVVGICGLAASSMLSARPQPASLFGDNAVLQRDATVPIWGTAEVGEKVTVRLDGTFAEAMADSAGRWKASLKTPSATATGELVFESDRGRVVSRNVVLGDVWLCSGQSNMEWTVKKAADADAEIATATYAGIRQFKVKPRVSESPQDDVEGEWMVCSPQTAGSFTAVGYYFARDIHRRSGVAQGLINSSWGSTIIETWSSLESLQARPELAPVLDRWREMSDSYPKKRALYDEALAAWTTRKKQAEATGLVFAEKKPTLPLGGPAHRNRPAGTFNAMIHPLVPYALRGVLWYQGEHNRERPQEYELLLQNLILDWRSRWRDPQLPFFIVQLPNRGSVTGMGWVNMREAQASALTLPATALAVTIDVGEANNAHPLNKQEVGRRLALLARQMIWKENVGATGPRLVSAQPEGGAVLLTFAPDASGLVLRDMPSAGRAFEVAGQDRQFHPADAVLKEGRIEVRSTAVPAPVAVRHAWRDDPAVILFNEAGVPAAPFRTDDWNDEK